MPFFASEAISLDSTAVLTAFVSFSLSVGAAALAIRLYSLLRTGQMGSSWRVLIIASVLFALLQTVRLAEAISPSAHAMRFSSVVEVVFILALSYAFWLQKQVFEEHRHRSQPKDSEEEEIESDLEPDALSTYERYS
ncbi:MAG: hypothetical protein EOP06_26910 [Proteobacteria bacterium]|nr:MAG: hypothetical protein EOP06_26910 [Pseudomonadota bacterium]